jgi:hypothetical protein
MGYYILVFVVGAVAGFTVGFLFGTKHGKRIADGAKALKDTLGKA